MRERGRGQQSIDDRERIWDPHQRPLVRDVKRNRKDAVSIGSLHSDQPRFKACRRVWISTTNKCGSPTQFSNYQDR